MATIHDNQGHGLLLLDRYFGCNNPVALCISHCTESLAPPSLAAPFHGLRRTGGVDECGSWVTPPPERKRFDTFFFLAILNSDSEQQSLHAGVCGNVGVVLCVRDSVLVCVCVCLYLCVC